MPRSLLLVPVTVLPLACLAVGALPPGGERVLEHEDYERWRTIEEPRLSRRGGWLSYRLQPPGDGDATLVLRATSGDAEHVVARGRGARVGYDERHAACLVKPERDVVRALKQDDEKDEKLPKNELAIVDLVSGAVETIERVKSFALPKRAGERIAWLHEKPLKGEDEAEEEAETEEGGEAKEEPAEEAQEEPEEEPEELTPEEKAQKKRDEKKKKARKDGTGLVARDLGGEREWRFHDVLEYAWSEDGRWLALVTSTVDDGGDGVVLLDTLDDVTTVWNTGLAGEVPEGEYKSLAFDEGSTQLAYLTNADAYQADPPQWSLYVHALGANEHRAIQPGDPRLAEGWGVSPHTRPAFCEDGARLFFGTRPLPAPEPDEPLEEDEVVVDVWSWTDDLIQPHQLEQLDDEQKRDYLALLTPGPLGALVQLGRPDMPDVGRPDSGHGDVFLGRSNLPYRRMTSWDTQVFYDVWAVDVASGERRELLTASRGSHRLSPGGRFVSWWDAEARTWRAQPTGGGDAIDLCADIPQRFDNELHDSPSLPRSYGAAGWLAGDEALLLYDRFDVWRVDPAGATAPVCVTEGLGRERGLRLRVVDLDREEEALDPDAPLLLSAFDEASKDAGFFADDLAAGGEPRELLLSPHRYSTPARAAEGDVLRFTRSSFAEFPDLWLSEEDLSERRVVSDANPQQAEYAWGTAELVEWTSTDGTPLQGLLYKPPGFDPSQKYPLITYFYERTSDRLHDYSPPTPHRSIIRFSFYAGRGYLVFAPDIPYDVGYPGQSALHAVLPGVTHLIQKGFVDEDAIGVQGHSWGGYQAAYLITQTDLFSAAVAGAVVSNMTSAYGGVRWSSGMSRMFQYEKTQSRIGGTLWEATPKYLDNSPLFYADRVSTPLLMMHNDRDGAVPWYQGIELFLALRRLDKPVWMLNYNGQPHWVTTWATQKDYARRMQQFFDHHLRGAPPAKWMVEGVPALDKGRDLGLDPVGVE